jgi:hypothetical protein
MCYKIINIKTLWPSYFIYIGRGHRHKARRDYFEGTALLLKGKVSGNRRFLEKLTQI